MCQECNKSESFVREGGLHGVSWCFKRINKKKIIVKENHPQSY